MTNKHRFRSLEDFYEQNESVTSNRLGYRVASVAYALKDLSVHSDETIALCRRLQDAVEKVAEGREAEWLVEYESSHVALNFAEWIDDCCVAGRLTEDEETGSSDIDINLENQKTIGTQMAALHDAGWAKAKLATLFSLDNFEPEDAYSKSLKYPLPALIDVLDRQLDGSVSNGMSHPSRCSAAVGAISLRLAGDESNPEEIIPLVRRVKISNVQQVVANLKEQAEEHVDDLKEGLKALKETLSDLPEGWPSDAVWQTTRDWIAKRYLGDAGLMGSDFFDGDWVKQNLPTDISRRSLVASLPKADAASMPALNQLALFHAEALRSAPAAEAKAKPSRL